MKSPLTHAEAPHPYAPAVRVGDLVFVSGRLGVADGELAPGGVEAEAAQAIRNAEVALAGHGLTLHDLAKVTIFLADMDDLQSLNKVYSKLVPEPRPARSCVAVAALPFGARVEMEFIASGPRDRADASHVV